jgi:hypothetical protein
MSADNAWSIGPFAGNVKRMPVSVPARGDRRRARRSLRLAIGLVVLAAIGTEPALSSVHTPVGQAALASSSVASGTHGAGLAYRNVPHRAETGPSDTACRVSGWAPDQESSDRVCAAPAAASPVQGDVALPAGADPHAAPGRAPPSRHA